LTMPNETLPGTAQQRPTTPACPRLDRSPHDDPPPPAGPASAAAQPAGPSTWPIIVVCRDGGTLWVVLPRERLEPNETRTALVVVLVDRAGRVRSAHCTCPHFKREDTCTHMWEASSELAAQGRRVAR
jgi:hypothetical protein